MSRTPTEPCPLCGHEVEGDSSGAISAVSPPAQGAGIDTRTAPEKRGKRSVVEPASGPNHVRLRLTERGCLTDNDCGRPD